MAGSLDLFPFYRYLISFLSSLPSKSEIRFASDHDHDHDPTT